MNLVYGTSQWTSNLRRASRHLDNGSGVPLCGGGGRRASVWAKEEGEAPSCDKCLRILKKKIKNGEKL